MLESIEVLLELTNSQAEKHRGRVERLTGLDMTDDSMVERGGGIDLPGMEKDIRARVGERKIPWKRHWQPILVFLPGKIPWTEESGELCESMWSHRVGHN